MPETIEWPMHGEPSRPKRLGFLIILVLIAVVLAGGRSAISYWVDLLWFRSLGYGDVLPVSDPARGLAVAEVVGGQLYLAVMVARLRSAWR